MFKNTALEMIGQQDLKFRAEMIQAWQDLIDNTDYGEIPTGNKYAQKIEDLLYKRTGLNCSLSLPLTDEWDFSATPFRISSYSPLFDAMAAVIPKAIVKPGTIDDGVQTLKGTIDFKNAKITGDYSRIVIPITMSIIGVKKEGAETAAGIFMHEAGHSWTILAASLRMYRSSQFLQQIARAKLGGDEERTSYIAQRYTTKMVEEGIIDKKDVKNLPTEFSIEGFQTLVLTSAVNKMQSDFGQLRGTTHHTEQVADIFATRFGFGSVVAKYAIFDDSDTVVNHFTKIFFITVLSCAFPSPLIAVMISSVFATLFAGEGFTGRLVNNYHDLYGTTSQRLTRIRQTVIDSLKDAHIKRETREFLLTEIARIDDIYKETHVVKDVFKIIHEMIFSSERKLAQVMEMERQLEALSNNDLFIGANRLKNLV